MQSVRKQHDIETRICRLGRYGAGSDHESHMSRSHIDGLSIRLMEINNRHSTMDRPGGSFGPSGGVSLYTTSKWTEICALRLRVDINLCATARGFVAFGRWSNSTYCMPFEHCRYWSNHGHTWAKMFVLAIRRPPTIVTLSFMEQLKPLLWHPT